MRALKRGDEIRPETMWTKWERENLAFLTGSETDTEGNPIKGDGWTLIENYEPEESNEEDNN